MLDSLLDHHSIFWSPLLKHYSRFYKILIIPLCAVGIFARSHYLWVQVQLNYRTFVWELLLDHLLIRLALREVSNLSGDTRRRMQAVQSEISLFIFRLCLRKTLCHGNFSTFSWSIREMRKLFAEGKYHTTINGAQKPDYWSWYCYINRKPMM